MRRTRKSMTRRTTLNPILPPNLVQLSAAAMTNQSRRSTVDSTGATRTRTRTPPPPPTVVAIRPKPALQLRTNKQLNKTTPARSSGRGQTRYSIDMTSLQQFGPHNTKLLALIQTAIVDGIMIMFATTFARNAGYNLTLPTILYIDAYCDYLNNLTQMYR